MKKTFLLLSIILIVAAGLRLYRLGENPPSLYWDEASLGYNAFAIVTTGHDEHGEFLPVARFIAFGDYKPPGYIYTLVPFMAFFGVNEFAIRLPSALAGILMVLGTYLLTVAITKNKASGLLAAGLLAISPWSLQLSRAAFEAHLAALFNLLGFLFFLCALKKKWLMPISILFFVLAFYTFNANRILSPLFIGLLGLIFWKELLQNKKWVIISIILGILLILPSITYLQTRESRLRFQEVSIFTSLNIIKKSNERIARSGNTWWAKIIHNRRIYFAKEFLSHYVDNFKGDFLFIHGDGNPRLSIGDVGELYLFEAPLLLVGLFTLLKKRTQATALLFGWMLIAPIPAATARETPHMLRIASILPTYYIVIAIGLNAIWSRLQTRKFGVLPAKVTKYTIGGLFVFLVLASFIYYQHNYWVHYPREWSGEWQYGYKQLVMKVAALESQYDKILITDGLGRPYIYFLLYNHINPLEYVRIRNADRDWYGLWSVYGFGRYDFKNLTDSKNERVLKVGLKGTFDSSGKKIDEVRDLQNRIVFEIGEP